MKGGKTLFHWNKSAHYAKDLCHEIERLIYNFDNFFLIVSINR